MPLQFPEHLFLQKSYIFSRTYFKVCNPNTQVVFSPKTAPSIFNCYVLPCYHASVRKLSQGLTLWTATGYHLQSETQSSCLCQNDSDVGVKNVLDMLFTHLKIPLLFFQPILNSISRPPAMIYGERDQLLLVNCSGPLTGLNLKKGLEHKYGAITLGEREREPIFVGD